ncbi:MAG: chemotaxis protein CheD [Treponema sp.]|nr:chemotaxis protein CheD [Treponema sp.]
MNTFFDNHFNNHVITIYPGEFFVSSGPEYISTILGSCVAVVLYDPGNQISGMNHYMLAKDNSKVKGENKSADKNSSASSPITRFGEYAMEYLVNEMQKKGAVKANLQAKIFGGANVFNFPDDSPHQVGNENINFALDWLLKEGIPVVAKDVGGVDSRKIVLDPVTSKVWLKRINQ